MGDNDTTRAELAWRKSSYSNNNGQATTCVEIAPLPDDGRAIRDSKLGDASGILRAGPAAWAALHAHLVRG